MGLLGRVKKAARKAVNPVHTVKRAVHYAAEGVRVGNKGIEVGAQYAKGTIAELRRRPAIGALRLAASATVVGAGALAAYDAKRLRDKTQSAKRKFRAIKKQALIDGDVIQRRLDGRPAPTPRPSSISPLHDGLGNWSSVAAPQSPYLTIQSGTAQETAPVQSDVEPGPGGVDSAPSPDERGAGGDAAEGTRTSLASVGGGLAGLFVLGLLAASLTRRKGE